MFKTNARTKTASALTASGDRLRLETPQFMAQCLTDRVPYVMPDPAGGYVLIAEYGDPCPEPKPEDKGTGCGCGGGCADQGKCNKPKNCEQKKPLSRCEQPNRAGLERDDEDRLLRFEIAKYSGYEADGVTLILTQRGVEGTIKQDWPVNTLVMQVMTGAELKDVYSSINGVKSFLDSLGCILAVPRNPDGACGGWNAGEWACFGGQFYRSKENGNCTTAPGAKWDCGIDLFDLLDLYCNGLVDCAGDKVKWTDAIVACRNMGAGLYWDETTKKWEVGGNKDCANQDITPSDRVVACRNMGSGLVWNATTKKWDVSTVKIIAIDDSGTQTTITLSDGTVISGPEIDKDDYVASFTPSKNAAGENALTITMKSGATHQVTLPAAAVVTDSYVIDMKIENGQVVLTRNNGLPPLVADLPKATSVVLPLLGARAGSISTVGQNITAAFTTFINAAGGFSNVLGTQSWPAPERGWHYFTNRATCRKLDASATGNSEVGVFKNGAPLATLGINFGKNYLPFRAVGEQVEVEKGMSHFLEVGDVIEVRSTNFTSNVEWMADTLNVLFQTAP